MKIYFNSANGVQETLEAGDIVMTYTGIPSDVYSASDPLVIAGKRKVGEPKLRYTLVLQILTSKFFVGITSTKSKKITKNNKIIVTNLDGEDYYFSIPLMRKWNVVNTKRFVCKAYPNKQLNNKILALKTVMQHPNYQKKVIKTLQSQKIKKGAF